MPISTAPLCAYVTEKVVPWIQRVEAAERGESSDQGMRLPALRRHIRRHIFALAAQVEMLLAPLHDHPTEKNAWILSALTRYHATLLAILDTHLPESRPFNPELLRPLPMSLQTITNALPREVPSLEELMPTRTPLTPVRLDGFPLAEASESER